MIALTAAPDMIAVSIGSWKSDHFAVVEAVPMLCRTSWALIGLLTLASCGGSSSNPVTPTSPLVTATIGAPSSFTQGQQGATFTVTVSNITGQTITLAGLGVQVYSFNQNQLHITDISGPGWSCVLNPNTTCSRTDNLAAGASYPPITVVSNLQSEARGSAMIGFVVQVSTPDNGGGMWSFSATVPITTLP